jgi:hypothetical protein
VDGKSGRDGEMRTDFGFNRALLYDSQIEQLIAAVLGCPNSDVNLRVVRGGEIELCLDREAHDRAMLLRLIKERER